MTSGLESLVRPDLDLAAAGVILGGVFMATCALIAAPIGATLAGGLAGNILQGPPALSLHPLAPKLNRLNPASGLAKAFKLKSWVEMLKAALKLVLFSAVAIDAARDSIAAGAVGAPGAGGALVALASTSATVLGRVVALVSGLAILDILFTRYEHVKQLRMTKQEVRDERREVEGDPLIRSRIRSRQMALARTRMMADVPKASVVVVNPTSYAVALRYVHGETGVPQVLAKGRNKIAERIRAVATEHGIAIVTDAPLARALYRAVPVGGFIPHRLYRAVAEVLALVMRRPGATRPRASQPDGGRS
jgi:flagellar biosynthetic protein FlhB